MTQNKNESLMCEGCFALTEECECEGLEENYEEKPEKTKPRGKWEPNIKENEKWEKVPSPYKAYKDGV